MDLAGSIVSQELKIEDCERWILVDQTGPATRPQYVEIDHKEIILRTLRCVTGESESESKLEVNGLNY